MLWSAGHPANQARRGFKKNLAAAVIGNPDEDIVTQRG
jgi:hypothetical protein